MIAAEMKYKKTGIDWIPEVPEHWEMRKLKFLVGLNEHNNLDNAKTKNQKKISLENIESWTGQFIESVSPIFEGQGCVFKTGDVLFSKLRPYLAKVFVPEYEGICVSELLVLTPKKSTIIPQFLFYRLISKAFIDTVDGSTYGAKMPRANWDFIGNLKIAFPPIEEQKAIADFLDNQSAKITHFIQTKQRFIELLKEQRQSIITNAVTKGIDENVKMKETVLGKIPEHWEIRRFKNVCLLQRGHDLPKEHFKEGEYPVYGSNGIIGYHKEFTTNAPCITIGRSGSVGEINFIEKNFWAHNTCLFVKENYNNDWEYLYFLISSIDIKMVSNGSAVPTLDRNNVHSLRVSYPPTIEEQKQIVEHIKTETKTLDIAISKAEREIELIKEYREAMIAEAVTGKMKL
jgi:type I restriction enzyme S subunit